MARVQAHRWIGSLVLPLVLVGLVAMHSLDAGAVGPATGLHHGLGEPGGPGGSHGDGSGKSTEHDCERCAPVAHVGFACAAVLASIALWRLHQPRIGSSAPALTIPSTGRPGRRTEPGTARHKPPPPWLTLRVILR